MNEYEQAFPALSQMARKGTPLYSLRKKERETAKELLRVSEEFLGRPKFQNDRSLDLEEFAQKSDREVRALAAAWNEFKTQNTQEKQIEARRGFGENRELYAQYRGAIAGRKWASYAIVRQREASRSRSNEQSHA